MNREGYYIYAITEADKAREFGQIGIGGREDTVYTIHYDGLAAVVSSSPIVKYPVSREHTMVHQKVLERVMEDFPLLPVRFCTIAEHEENIKEKVLKARASEFRKLLAEIKDKVELGTRAFWTNMRYIFAEIVSENKTISMLKERVEKEKSEQKAYAGKIRLGEMVKNALEKKKNQEAEKLLSILCPLAEDYRENRILGDRNIFNTAFLVRQQQEHKFDQKVNQLQQALGERTKLKYFGPVPPYNFVEVVVTWS